VSDNVPSVQVSYDMSPIQVSACLGGCSTRASRTMGMPLSQGTGSG
jgi:hypothetical protein